MVSWGITDRTLVSPRLPPLHLRKQSVMNEDTTPNFSFLCDVMLEVSSLVGRKQALSLNAHTPLSVNSWSASACLYHRYWRWWLSRFLRNRTVLTVWPCCHPFFTGDHCKNKKSNFLVKITWVILCEFFYLSDWESQSSARNKMSRIQKNQEHQAAGKSGNYKNKWNFTEKIQNFPFFSVLF